MVVQCSVEVHGHSRAHGGVMWRWHSVVVFECRSGVGWRCLSGMVVLGVVVMEARRALRALKAVVRLQAIFHGWQVRKQAAVTLRCMQALVRVQAHVKPRNVGNSQEGKSASERCNEADPVKQAEQGWCDIPRTVEEVKAKLQMRQEGAIKRDRTKAYSQSKMVLRFFVVRVSATQLLAFFCYP
ncbi:hypothetical protein JHK87_055665 [Glycine soja]|nr:hypothetical protein JHK87_055665 [Glycine soja]